MANARTVFINSEFSRRFQDAWQSCRAVYFTAQCGCGKTCTAAELLREETADIRSALDSDCLDFEKRPLAGDCSALVLDDMQYITDPTLLKALCDDIRNMKNVHFLLISRAPLPGMLMPFLLSGMMEVFDMSWFQLNRDTAYQLLSSDGCTVTYDEMTAIHTDFRGYPIALCLLKERLRRKSGYNASVLRQVKTELFRYINEAVYLRLPAPMRTLLLSVAPFEKFNLEMARMVSGDSHAGERIAVLQSESSMMFTDDEGMSSFPVIFREFLLWRIDQEYAQEEKRTLLARAGLYYEIHDDIAHALECYSMGGDRHKVRSMLEKHADMHPSIAHYYEVEKYYMALPREEILRSPALMCGMSMLCAMTMDFDTSEEWYRELKFYAGRLSHSDSQYREAQSRIAYLDISLPQRSTTELSDLCINLYSAVKAREISLPIMSVTSMMPSLMNGGKDFSEWSKKDDVMYITMGKPLSFLMGRNGVCFADCALCESKFEKGENVFSRLLSLVARLGEVQSRGTPDMEFAIVGLLARQQLMEGQADAAKDTIQTLRNKYSETGLTRFLPNMDAMLCRIALHANDQDFVSAWLREKAPRDLIRMRGLSRYQYITRAMVEIKRGDFSSALIILAQMKKYCEACSRTLDGIAVDVLYAISRYRIGDETWKSDMCHALDTAEKYRFIPCIAQYGAAVLPLLRTCEWQGDSKYLARLTAAARTQAIYYPQFFSDDRKLTQPLSETERQVLRLICSNMSNQEIGEVLDIKLATVKTHVSHILQKLGVSRRSEAQEAAETLHLF